MEFIFGFCNLPPSSYYTNKGWRNVKQSGLTRRVKGAESALNPQPSKERIEDMKKNNTSREFFAGDVL